MARRGRRNSLPKGGDENYVSAMEEDSTLEESFEEARSYAPMDDEEFRTHVHTAAKAAEDYIDTTISPARVVAAEYYRAAPFGDEENGRSHIVLSEVRDTIQSIIPSLMRIFTSGQKIVEYMPRTAEDIKPAEQASDAVNFVFQEMNPGFSILYSAFKDALLKKTGIVTWWAESDDRVVERQFSGLSEEEILLFQQQNPTAEIISLEQEESMMGPMYDMSVKLVDRQAKYRVRALPPECFIVDRRARDLDRYFDICGIRDLVTVSDLVEMGYDAEEIMEHGSPGSDDLWASQMEEQQRNPGSVFLDDNTDESLRRVKYFKLWMRVDRDGDGVAELRCIHAVGDTCYILKDEVVDHVPIALFCPDPEPHTIFGHSIADVTMDLQKIKSHVMRATLDSLAQSIYPRTVVVEGQVNIDDVLNKEVGSVIRARQAGAVQDLQTPFVAQPAMGIIDYLDQVKAQRTGVTPASQGLDADLLQSTTKAAVTAQISAAQERTEMIARVFSETGMKQLFSGLLKLITRHQDKPLLVRLRGEWVPVDPTTWNADMDCSVAVALGRGDDAQQMNFLGMLAQKQEQIIQTMGMGNPIVRLSQYQQTLSQLVRMAGFKNPDSFFSPVTPQQEQQLAQSQAQAAEEAKANDPNRLLAQVEAEKVRADAFAKLQNSAIDRARLQLDADLERDKLESDVILKAMDLSGKYGSPVDWQSILALTTRPRPDVNALAQSLIDQEKATGAQILAQLSGNKPQ